MSPAPTERLLARWLRRPLDHALAAQLCSATGLPPLLARILAARGLTCGDSCQRFLKPALAHLHDPFEMAGMSEAVDCLAWAIREQQPIWIYGDYDVDGISATAILLLTLRELGCAVDYYIPHRLDEGYGLNREALEQLAQQGARVVVTVDCGITAVEEARRARELGLELIITDHHEPGHELPEARAVINPKRPGCPYPFKSLAGAGVAFKLAHALLKRLHRAPEVAREFLKGLLDLASLGTVADIVPMFGENRSLVTHGLRRLRETQRVGLRQLMRRASLAPEKVDAGSIGFVLGPRLNAAGRTEHAMFGVELLLTEDAAEAQRLAEQLEKFNDNRRALEQKILNEALTMIDGEALDPVIVVAAEGWHPGVLGIVASRILSQYYRPTLVLSIENGMARGSGRSIDGFDLHGALDHCSELLDHFGGHKMAAGVALETARLEEFREAINIHARAVLDEEMLRPVVTIDADAKACDLRQNDIARLEELAPHGPDNPRPVVALEGYMLVEAPRVLRDRHLKLWLAGPDGDSLAALGWGMADRLGEMDGYRGEIRLAGTPFINNWNGRSNVEFELKDFQFA